MSDDVAGYRSATIERALAAGSLKHLVTLELKTNTCFNPAYLDSDVFKWCTPVLEDLNVDLINLLPWEDVEGRKFFVNLPKLRKLCMFFDEGFPGARVIEDTPLSVTELRVFWEVDTESLPYVLQPGLQKLSVDASDYDNSIVSDDLHLECR